MQRVFLPLVAGALFALSSACSSTSQSVSVSVTPGSANVNQGASQLFTAVVSGTSNTHVSWSVREPAGGTIDGNGNYVAPNGAGTFHVIATSAADTSKTGMTVVTVPEVGVKVSPPSMSLGFGAVQTFTASVTGTINSAVAWSLAGDAGTAAISSDGQFSAPYSRGSFTVVATSVADPTKTGMAAVTVAEVVSLPTVIGVDGGEVCSPGGVCVDIPAGALTQPTTITISEAIAPAPSELNPLSPLHQFDPAGTVFDAPVTVSMPVPTGTADASLAWTKVGFAEAVGGATAADLEPLDATVTEGKLSARVIHFSQGAAIPAAQTRSIFGVFGKFHHPPGTALAFLPTDLSNSIVFADTVDGGSQTRQQGVGYADGLFSVSDMPSSGVFRLFVQGGGYNWTTGEPVAKTVTLPGRADVTPWDSSHPAPANLALALTGLAPWVSGDYVELVSAGAFTYVPGGLPIPNPDAGTTNFSGTVAMNSPAICCAPNAIEGNKGDQLVVLQEEPRVAPNGDSYSTVVASLVPEPFDLTDGSPNATVSGALQALPLDHSINCNYQISQFASAVQTSLPVNLAGGSTIDPVGGSFLGVFGNFGPLEEGILFSNADLLIYSHTADDQDVASTGPMAFGLPAPLQLPAFALVRYSKYVHFLLPGNTASVAAFPVGMDETFDVGALCAGPVVPLLTPVQNLQVNGMDARQPLQAVPSNAVISWTAPAIGTPVRYVVYIYLLSTNASDNTTYSEIADFFTDQTQVPLPLQFLKAGNVYVFYVEADAALTGVTSDTTSYVVTNTISP